MLRQLSKRCRSRVQLAVAFVEAAFNTSSVAFRVTGLDVAMVSLS